MMKGAESLDDFCLCFSYMQKTGFLMTLFMCINVPLSCSTIRVGLHNSIFNVFIA